MDNTRRAVPPNLSVPKVDRLIVNDEAAMAQAVRWIAERYLMSDAFARILLSQLARQDGVTEAVAARSVLTTAVIEAATPTSLP